MIYVKEKRKCAVCSKEFLERRSVMKSCCSRECLSQYRKRNRVKINCIVCGKERIVPASKSKSKTCSRECFAKEASRRQTIKNTNWKGRVKIVKCIICGKDTKDYMGNKRFCSLECKSQWQIYGLKGENNPFYGRKHSDSVKLKLHYRFSKGEISNLNKSIRSTHKYNSWRNEVYKRDNYTCKNCGKRGGVLNAHHDIHLSDIIEQFCEQNNIVISEIKREDIFKMITNDIFFDKSNGITLCKVCHKEKHNQADTITTP